MDAIKELMDPKNTDSQIPPARKAQNSLAGRRNLFSAQFGNRSVCGYGLCIDKTTGDDACGGIKFGSDSWCLIQRKNSVQYELSTFVHELGHVLGAPDHYGSDTLNTPGTSTLNTNPDHPDYLEGNKYNEYCIYGENNIPGQNAKSTLTICEGCTYKIRNYISKLIAGTEQIG